MWKIWKGKNVNLEALAASMLDFFKSKGCVCRSAKSFEKIKIYVRLRGGSGRAIVTVSGLPENFKVEFFWERKLLQFFTNFASLFGGGIFVSKAISGPENGSLDRFEDEFWNFMENVVTMLSSAPKLK